MPACIPPAGGHNHPLMKWFYARQGKQQGPVDAEELQARIAAGELAATDLVWREGMREWAPLTTVAELSSYLPAAKPATPTAPSASVASVTPVTPVASAVPASSPIPEVPAVSEVAGAPGGAPAAGAAAPYQVTPGGPAPEGAGKATVALVLGIVATLFALCGCYGILLTLPCGIIAVVMGRQVLRQAETDPRLLPEVGKAKTGMILGWIGLGLVLVSTVVMFAVGFGQAILREIR